ncbi:NADH dehydrogenase [Oceanobacillus iheyensis HTE831]|uniref:NADH dehydrogenase n=1 Tax=Oceanobacillus iheyensis (strain DSM 14371 / CIP 107618 / JCM 11309 / KCTC 3954 / HTE831) TaxID=221109 RepID=Q8EPU5_OCEIH|nr:Na+/H+ antiporter subunit A [Oceanobacillus iheyensis]BAC13947.1 NADH dehydrogenase [Oceanobacillus iheyensis HTE831]
MTVLHWATLSPFLIAILIPFLYKYVRKVHTGWFVLLLPFTLFIYFLSFLSSTREGNVISEHLAWVPSLGINFNLYIDGLSLLFALLITGIGTLVVLYSIFYLSDIKEKLNNFYVYLLMFMGAMLGVVLSDNLIVIYVFWEVTSIASSLLISYWYGREKSIYGAQKSMYITVFGGLSMLGGFSLLYVIAGTFSIRELIANADIVMASSLFLPAMILVLLGAFTKSAQFPFHIWLPDAMEAPTPVSAYLHSATMVKAGIYLVARLTGVFGGSPEWFWIITIAGLTTLAWGSISAVRQKDLKGILAFSTISQLGLIMSLLGVGSAAFYFQDGNNALYTTAILAAVFHLINHATFKGSLFMAVGIIDHETGTRDIRNLGGLMTIMPITATVSLVGLASMAGLPPFNGFLSKELFFTGMLNATEYGIFNLETMGYIIPIVAWIASVFTFLYCMIMFFRTFTGKFDGSKLKVDHVHEAPIGMLISPVILGILVILFGLFPNVLAYSLIEPAMAGILPGILNPGEFFNVHITHWHGFIPELFMTIGVIVLGVILYLSMSKWQKTAFYLGERDIFNYAYDYGYDGLIKGSQWITRIQMTGRLRDYFIYMCGFMILLIGYTMYKFNLPSFNTMELSPIEPFIWIVAIVFIGSVIAVPFINNRLGLIILTGVTGYIVALFFVVFRAPDLALTQLLVETVTVILFMLAFYHLPKLKKEKTSKGIHAIKLIISISFGVMITLVSLSAFSMGSTAGMPSISEYFTEFSKELAGGYNIVNVILVDFRGLDTMLEILVVGVAVLSIISLIKLRFKGSEDV